MANNNKHTGPNVPALRFPEFSGEWEQCKLRSIGYAYNGLSGKSGSDFGVGAPFITYKSVFDNSKIDIRRTGLVTITEQERLKHSQNIVRKGDAFFTISSETPEEVGMSSVLLDDIDDCYLNSFCFGYRPTSHSVTSDYLRYYLRSPKLRKKIMILAQGSTRFNISKDEVLNLTVSLPSLDEQNKIARTLDLIEERIETQIKIIEELKNLRGALNESLYCCCESYQELSFNDVGVSYSGLSGKSGNDFGSGYPFIPYTNIFTNNIIDEGQLEYVQVREEESQNIVCFGDLLMTLSSETPEEVGIGAVYLGHKSPLYLNSFAFGIHITRTDLVYPPYLSWIVSTKSFRKFILPYAQGSTRYNLQKTDFMKAKYRFPTLGRQKAISVLLSGYSSKIENEERVLNT